MLFFARHASTHLPLNFAWQRFACTKVCCGVLFWGWSQRLSLDQERVWNNKRSGTVEGLGKLRVWFSWGSTLVVVVDRSKVWISWGSGRVEGLDQSKVWMFGLPDLSASATLLLRQQPVLIAPVRTCSKALGQGGSAARQGLSALVGINPNATCHLWQRCEDKLSISKNIQKLLRTSPALPDLISLLFNVKIPWGLKAWPLSSCGFVIVQLD